MDDLDAINMAYPLFVNPAKARDSLGIEDKSLVNHQPELEQQVANLLNEYDEVLVEEYINGREFTVLVAASVDGKSCRAFTPVEFIFPAGNANTIYAGLNVIAVKDILQGEELTLDYALLLNDTAQGFQCSCKAPNCRGSILGIKR